ncbi:MAG: hypothetical protein ACC628_07885 [Pirellulaceae bacterium]
MMTDENVTSDADDGPSKSDAAPRSVPTDHATDNAAEQATEPAGESRERSLEELETKIRSQLKELIVEAKRCRDKVLNLLKRAEPFQVVRKSLGKVVRNEHLHIQTLHDEQGRVVDERVARIRQVSSDLTRDVELRREGVESQQQAWNNLIQTNGAAAERWSRAVNERRTDLQGELSDFHEWLALAGQRWVAPEQIEIDDV